MKKLLQSVRILVLGTGVMSPCFVYGQVGDIIARRNLVVRGQARADVQLLAADGAITIAESALVHGDARVPQDVTNPVDGPTRRIASTVKVNVSAASSVLHGQLREAPSFDLPVLAAPRPSPGTQAVHFTGAGKAIPRFDHARDILIQNADQSVALPPGAYGRLTVENARVLLGVAGAYRAARYDFTLVDLKGPSRIELAGPVIITAGELGDIEGVIGRDDLPGWLDLRVARGGIALKRGSAVFGSLYAPTSEVVLEDGAVAEGWLAGEAVTIERTGRFGAKRFDWDAAARPEMHPVFPQEAVLIQNRLAGLTARLAGHFTVAVAYDDDVPTLTLTELPRRETEKVTAKDNEIFFDAFRVLLAGSFAEEARVIMRKAPGKDTPATGALDVRMTNTDFEGHLWAVGGEELSAESVRKIQASSGLQHFFLLRSLTVAKAAVGDTR